MLFFLDSADTSVIKDLAETGLIDGITTNPSLVAKTGKNFFQILEELSHVISGPISAEVVSETPAEMYKEALELSKIASNIVIKLPLTFSGLKVCQQLTQNKIKTNLTLCFQTSQMMLAAKAGAYFVSPFVGRLDDVGAKGLELLMDCMDILRHYSDLNTRILAASLRNVAHVEAAAKIGVHAATIPPKVFEALIKHPLTDKGLEIFASDWATVKGK